MFGAGSDYRILSMMIAPALFMTATGSLIISSNNRLGRIVDRIRVLLDLCDRLSRPDNTLDHPELRRRAVRSWIANLHARNGRIRHATSMLYLAFTMFVGASLSIAVEGAIGHRAESVPTFLAVAGVGALLWAGIYLFLETRAATYTVKLEIEFLNELTEARRAVNDGGVPNVSTAKDLPVSG
jgi:hypothetical protein